MFSNIFSRGSKVGNYEYVMTEIQMQRVIQDLEKRVAELEKATSYHTDEYIMFLGKPTFVPLNEVVRKIANHLGMKLTYKHAQPEGYDSEFKRPEPTAAKGKNK